MNHAPSAGSGGASATSNNADAINAAQTLSDLKKQRSMHRVAQQSPRSSDNQRDNHGQGHQRGNSGNSSSSHHSSKQKQKEDNNHRHSSKRNSKNGSRNGHRSSNNVKKFASPTEVVGPSPKKVGCCRVMWIMWWYSQYYKFCIPLIFVMMHYKNASRWRVLTDENTKHNQNWKFGRCFFEIWSNYSMMSKQL